MLPSLNEVKTMSSREIAALTRKDHGDVLKDIRRILDEAEIDGGEFSGVYKGANGQDRPCFNLPRRECDLVIAGYSVKYRLAIIDRWQELEAQQAFKVPQTFSAALLLAGELQAKVETQQILIEQQKPAVEFVERFVEAKSSKGIREVAKILSIPEREFINQLVDDGVIFRLAGNLVPMAAFQKRGLFEVKAGEANGHAFKQMRFTPDGVVWAAKRYAMTGCAS